MEMSLWLGHQRAQSSSSKALCDVHDLTPSQCLNQGRKMVLAVPVTQWLQQEFGLSGSSADACTPDMQSEMRWMPWSCIWEGIISFHFKCGSMANIRDAFTSLHHRSSHPATSARDMAGQRGCAALGSAFKGSGWKMCSLTASWLSVRCLASCRIVLCITHLGDLSLSAVPYKGISAEHASIMLLGIICITPSGWIISFTEICSI